MNVSELLNADQRVLAGLIGKVWSANDDEQSDLTAKANAELYIRMYIEEAFLHSRPPAAGFIEPDAKLTQDIQTDEVIEVIDDGNGAL